MPFKKHSIFFKYLNYWKDLEVRHAIDVMHLEKNVFDSTIGALLRHAIDVMHLEKNVFDSTIGALLDILSKT